MRSRHLFTSREGGVSEGIYESLNLRRSCDDDPERVRRNFEIVRERLGCSAMVYLSQQHTDRILHVGTEDAVSDPYGPLQEADGMITRTPGLGLMVFGADCVPILLEGDGIVAAVHAGWRGTANGILSKAVREMECSPSQIRAWIGPAIGPCCYEVGDEVRDAMHEAFGKEAEAYFTGRNIDLKGLNALRLRDAGVQEVSVSEVCTMCRHTEYWSHRYTAGKRGVQGGIIMLNKEENA